MAAMAAASAALSAVLSDQKPLEPNTEVIRQRLLRKGVVPTPKILHTLRKKEAQKALRKANKRALREQPPPLTESQRRDLEEDDLFRAVSAEFRAVREELRRRGEKAVVLSGRPWERSKALDFNELTSAREDLGGERLRTEHLEELRRMLAERNGERFRWLLVDDEVEYTCDYAEKRESKHPKSTSTLMLGDEEKIRMLVDRLSSSDLSIHDWKFSRIMKQSGLLFTEMSMLKIVDRLGRLGNWSQAMSVVKWVYNEKAYKHKKSRFVYTKLLSVLGKARRPIEALQVFKQMLQDGQLYPDMAAYHSISVTLGQAGLVKELINIIECMKQKPSSKLKNMNRRNWDPCLEPDVIIYNAVLNACIPSHQWKGVFWVREQMRHSGLKPSGPTYGLAMECVHLDVDYPFLKELRSYIKDPASVFISSDLPKVMLKAGKYDLVHKFFEKMKKGGITPNALTYKVLVRAFSEEDKLDEAVQAVREMEQRGIVGTANVYYELACCLCNKGRWQDAVLEVMKLKRLPRTKPLEVAFTGMILSSLDGGRFADCISIFEHMKDHCTPNIGTINAMLKVYCHGDMFAKAKELFEATKVTCDSLEPHSPDGTSLQPDAYSYKSMLEACARAEQWEYFEHVYREMTLSGFQLDHRKQSQLLVKASKAGKWHLLEHAFDSILEAEEVPHVSLFTAMICQTIVQRNSKRTASLLNGMAHASLKVSENEWTNLLQRETDKHGVVLLQELLNNLESSNLVMEDPVPSFLKSLRYVCGASLLKGGTSTSSSAHACEASTDDLTVNEDDIDLESGSKEQSYMLHKLPPEIDGGLSTASPDPYPSCDRVQALDEGSCTDGSSQIKVDNEAYRLPVGDERNESRRVQHDRCKPSFTDTALDLLTADTGTPFTGLPSASEILEMWRKDRIKDDVSHWRDRKQSCRLFQ